MHKLQHEEAVTPVVLSIMCGELSCDILLWPVQSYLVQFYYSVTVHEIPAEPLLWEL